MIKKTLLGVAAAVSLFAMPLTAQAKDELTICVWDIVGQSGPAMQAMREWQTHALELGVKTNLKTHTNEALAAEELKAGKCDAALITGIRGRQFNKYTGTLDSLGGMPTDDHLRTVLRVLANPASAPKLKASGYSILGLAPAGAAYIFVRDKEINTLAKAAGKKVAVLEYDPTQAALVSQVGATPVPSDITNFSSRFNNGQVDVIASPLMAFDALELYRGLTPDGAIIDYPLIQITLQLIGRSESFDDEFAQKSREYFFGNFDKVQESLKREAANIDSKWMQDIPEEDKVEYDLLLQEARVELRDQGHYDGDMLQLQRRVRCNIDAGRSECTDPVE